MSRKISGTRSSHHNATPNLRDLSSKLSKVQISSKRFSANRQFSSKSFSLDNLIERLRNGQYKRIVVLAGAGISTPSGIPDFRTPGTGLYDNLQRYNIPYPEAIFELNYFSRNPKPFFHLAKELYPGKYRPNIIHYFIRYLYDQNLLRRVYTQNIDGLERMAGIPAEKIVEAHGTFMTATCQRCRQKYHCEDIRQKIFDDQIPMCTKTQRCTGVIKPDIVFFGENLPDRFQLYLQDLPMCDCCIVMGTSLAVYPFADIVDSTARSTARLLINRQRVGTFLSPKPFDVTMIGDLEMNVKEFLKKLSAFDKVMELMEKENAEDKNKIIEQNKSDIRANSAKTKLSLNSDRFQAAETFLEQKRKFSTWNSRRQGFQLVPQPKISFLESTKLMIEKRNDSLLFNRQRSKSALPSRPLKQSSSSSSSSDSLNSSSSDIELMPYAFQRPTDTKIQPVRQIVAAPITKLKRNSLLNATLRADL